MDGVTANGRAKVKGSLTPNFNHKYDKIGERIMRDLHRKGSCKVYINPMVREIVLELVRLGVAKKTECFNNAWLVETVSINRKSGVFDIPVGKIQHVPDIGVKPKKKSKWR